METQKQKGIENENIKKNKNFSIEDKFGQALNQGLESEGLTYEDDVLDEVDQFEFNFNGELLKGHQGLKKMLNILNVQYSNNSSFLDLLLKKIISEGYIDIETLMSSIKKILLLNEKEQKEQEKEQKEQKEVENKNTIKEQLNYIYRNFNIEGIPEYNSMLNEASKNVDEFLEKNPNLQSKKEEYIKSYILIQNKKKILSIYKSNIGNNNYNNEGLEELENSINGVSKTLKHTDIKFNKFLYQENIEVKHIVSNANIHKILKSKIGNSLSPVCGKDKKVKYEGDYIVVGDQRVKIEGKGKVVTEVFNEENYALKIDTDLPLALLDSYNTIELLNGNLNQLNTSKKYYEDKYKMLNQEYQEYLNEGYENQHLSQLQEKLNLFQEHINEIEEKIENTKRTIKINNDKIKQLEYKTRIVNQEKADKARKTMEFLNEIGFDLLPQELTDELFKRLNTSSTLRGTYGFDTEINLSEGSLGIERDFNTNDISIMEKIDFAKFINIFISGNEEGPINISDLAIGFRPVQNRTKFAYKLIEYGLMSGNSFSLTKGLDNLNKFYMKKQ